MRASTLRLSAACRIVPPSQACITIRHPDPRVDWKARITVSGRNGKPPTAQDAVATAAEVFGLSNPACHYALQSGSVVVGGNQCLQDIVDKTALRLYDLDRGQPLKICLRAEPSRSVLIAPPESNTVGADAEVADEPAKAYITHEWLKRTASCALGVSLHPTRLIAVDRDPRGRYAVIDSDAVLHEILRGGGCQLMIQATDVCGAAVTPAVTEPVEREAKRARTSPSEFLLAGGTPKWEGFAFHCALSPDGCSPTKLWIFKWIAETLKLSDVWRDLKRRLEHITDDRAVMILRVLGGDLDGHFISDDDELRRAVLSGAREFGVMFVRFRRSC